MKTVPIYYVVSFWKWYGTGGIEWSVDLTDEEAAAYDAARAAKEDLDLVPKLQNALERAYADIEAYEIKEGIEREDEEILACQGLLALTPEEVNELVWEGNPGAIAYFELEDLSDEEREEWDVGDLDELPTMQEIDPDFVPESPFDVIWDMNVHFAENDSEEDASDDES